MNKFTHKHRTDLYCSLFLFVLTLIFFSKFFLLAFTEPGVLSNPRSADLTSQFFPWRNFGFQSLKNWELPLWNPYLFCGSPFLGEIQTSLFYPLNAIFLFLPPHIGLTTSIIIHIYLSGLFTYFFLRTLKLDPFPALSGAITFMFSSPIIFHIYPGHISNICTIAWIPLIFLFLEALCSRYHFIFAPLLGLAFACQILAGHIQYVFYTGVGMLIFLGLRLTFDSECRKKWKVLIPSFLLAMVISLLLTAVQLLPTLEAVSLSVRKELSFDFVGTFSLPPENLLTLLLPGFFGDDINTRYWGRCYIWEMCFYIGLIPLLLVISALISRRRTTIPIVFALFALITMVLALGKYTPVLKLLYHYVPGFDLFRGSSKFISLTVFALSVLCAYGVRYFLDNLKQHHLKFIRLQAMSCLGLALLLLGFLGMVSVDNGSMWAAILQKSASLPRSFNPLGNVNHPDIIHFTLSWTRQVILSAVTFLIFGGAFFFLAAAGKIKGKSAAVALILFIILDLWTLGLKNIAHLPLNHCYWDEDLVAFLKKDQEIYRVGLVNEMVPGLNQGMNHGISDMGGYGSNSLERFAKLFNLSQGLPPDSPTLVMNIEKLSRLTDLLNLKYLIAPADLNIFDSRLERVFENQEVTVYRNTQYLPRTFLVRRARLFTDENMLFNALLAPDFNPINEIFLEQDFHEKTTENPVMGGKDSANILHYGLNRIIIETHSPVSTFLVLSDIFYPGWKVYVDGKEEHIFRAYYTLRSVQLPAGNHRVTFLYSPWSVKLGFGISLTSLFGLGLMIFFSSRRSLEEATAC